MPGMPELQEETRTEEVRSRLVEELVNPMSEQKPLTMSPEREALIRKVWDEDGLVDEVEVLAELDAERVAHAETREHLKLEQRRIRSLFLEREDYREQLAQAIKFSEFCTAQAEWSQATFGTDAERGPVGPLKHLAKEVQEALANIEDEMEYVDCFFLVLDASRRAKIPAHRLLDLSFEKLEINKARKWNKPTSDDPVEHDRTKDGVDAKPEIGQK